MAEDLLYRREINKSVLYDGFGIDREYLDIFLSRIQPLQRGDVRRPYDEGKRRRRIGSSYLIAPQTSPKGFPVDK